MTTVTSVPFWVKTAVSPQKPNVMVAEWPSPGGPAPASVLDVAPSELVVLWASEEEGTTAAASVNSPPLSNPAVPTVLPELLPVPTTTPETLPPVPLTALLPLPARPLPLPVPPAVPTPPPAAPLPLEDGCCGLLAGLEQALVDAAIARANVTMHPFVARDRVLIVCIGAQCAQRLSRQWSYVTLMISSGQLASACARRHSRVCRPL